MIWQITVFLFFYFSFIIFIFDHFYGENEKELLEDLFVLVSVWCSF